MESCMELEGRCMEILISEDSVLGPGKPLLKQLKFCWVSMVLSGSWQGTVVRWADMPVLAVQAQKVLS